MASFALGLSLAGAAHAQTPSPLTGDYVCVYGCRLTDANPSVAIHDGRADCVNEFGGLFVGRPLGETSLACFNKTGALDADGETLRWSDGVIWKRHLGSTKGKAYELRDAPALGAPP